LVKHVPNKDEWCHFTPENSEDLALEDGQNDWNVVAKHKLNSKQAKIL
jgi:hypothetical protein